jgi:hypothetical protein
MQADLVKAQVEAHSSVKANRHLVLQALRLQACSAIRQPLALVFSVEVRAHLVDRQQATVPLEAAILEEASHSVNPNQALEAEVGLHYSAPLVAPLVRRGLVQINPIRSVSPALGQR